MSVRCKDSMCQSTRTAYFCAPLVSSTSVHCVNMSAVEHATCDHSIGYCCHIVEVNASYQNNSFCGYYLSVNIWRKDTVVNFRYWKFGRFLSFGHMTQLGHILSIHEPPWPIRCDRGGLDPNDVHALFVNMCTERFGNYDCLVENKWMNVIAPSDFKFNSFF